MPYGYNVDQTNIPQVGSPIDSAVGGVTQGITLGLGLQRARQDAQNNQLQQQAAIQEMERKKFNDFKSALELTQTPSFKHLAKKDQAVIGKHLGEQFSNYLGQPIDIPEWKDEFSTYTKRINEVLMDDNIPEAKKRTFISNILGEAADSMSEDKFSQLEKISNFGLKQPQQTSSSFVLAGSDQSGNLIGYNNKTFETKVTPSPTGKPLLPKNLTAEMANSSLYATRANDANQQLNDLMAGGFDPTALSSGAQKLLPNYFQGEKVQALEQIGRNLGAAILRKESGAAITKDEWEQVKLQYIPQPGDKLETLKQKEINRQRAIQGLGQAGGQLPELPNPAGASNATSIKFNSIEEAESANLPIGTIIEIGGRKARVE